MWRVVILALFPVPLLACDMPICQVAPGTLNLTRLITFDDIPSGWDPGHRIDDLLSLPGASFAERFAGQSLETDGDFDQVIGAALPPLTLLPGAPGESLSVVRMNGSNIVNGFGPAGYPLVSAQGEGAIAILFDDDQPSLSFQVLGVEAGVIDVQFLDRRGVIIHSIAAQAKDGESLGFVRPNKSADIAGIVITNTDPQGLAIDNVRFNPPPQLG